MRAYQVKDLCKPEDCIYPYPVYLEDDVQSLEQQNTALVSALEGLVGCPDLPDLIAKAETDGRRGLELKFSIIGLRQAIQALHQNKAGV